jgi:hypothetical protein
MVDTPTWLDLLSSAASWQPPDGVSFLVSYRPAFGDVWVAVASGCARTDDRLRPHAAPGEVRRHLDLMAARVLEATERFHRAHPPTAGDEAVEAAGREFEGAVARLVGVVRWPTA